MTTDALERLAELDRIYERVMERATDQMMPGGRLSRQEAGYRNGRGKRHHRTTVREDVRRDAEAFMLALAARSEDEDARRFAALVEERSGLIELRNALAEAVFDPQVSRRMEAIVVAAKSKNGGPPIPELVSFAEIAELAGVSRQAAHKWAEQDGFPAPVAVLKAGKVFSKPAVEAWLEERAKRKDGAK